MGIQIYIKKHTHKKPADSFPRAEMEKALELRTTIVMTEWPGRLFQVAKAYLKLFLLCRFILTRRLSGILFYIYMKEYFSFF